MILEPFLILLIFSLKRICYEDKLNQRECLLRKYCTKIMVIIFYSSFFIGYFIYFLVKYINIIENEKNFTYFKKFKYEIIIEYLIEFLLSKNSFEKTLVVIVELYLILFSLVIILFALIVNIITIKIVTKREDMWKNKTIPYM